MGTTEDGYFPDRMPTLTGNDLILLCLPPSGAPVAREDIVAFCAKWQPG